MSRAAFHTGLTVAALGTAAYGADLSAQHGMQAFAAHCFSPALTAQKARDAFDLVGVRHDFYNLAPYGNSPLSPAVGHAVTHGTDRRCDVSFDGDHAAQASQVAQTQLEAEGIRTEAPLPDTHSPTAGTQLLAARYLNPNRIAVVHVGTRPGPNGIETFMNVERLTPSASKI